MLTAFGIPALAALVTQLTPRAGFEWRYVSGALVALCWLAAAAGTEEGAWRRVRALGAAGVALAALVISLANLADPGEEDYRGAVTALLAEARPGDKVVAADWQPELFPHALGYRYYAAELAALDEHARGCEACALQLRLEREISAAAPALQKDWDTPALWARIESRLEQQKGSTVLDFPRGFAAHWRLAAAAVVGQPTK